MKCPRFVPDVTFLLNVMSNPHLTSRSLPLLPTKKISMITTFIFKWESHLEPDRSLWHLNKWILVWSLPRVLCYIILHCVTHMLSVSKISRKFGSVYSDKGQASVEVCVTAILMFLLVLLSQGIHFSSVSVAARSPVFIICLLQAQLNICSIPLVLIVLFEKIHINITLRLIGEDIPALSSFHMFF